MCAKHNVKNKLYFSHLVAGSNVFLSNAFLSSGVLLKIYLCYTQQNKWCPRGNLQQPLIYLFSPDQCRLTLPVLSPFVPHHVYKWLWVNVQAFCKGNVSLWFYAGQCSFPQFVCVLIAWGNVMFGNFFQPTHCWFLFHLWNSNLRVFRGENVQL